ncbi:efflux RND transporter permease subunit [Bacillus solimangrovi]|uniref:Acriflavin resistance protein n=1 Tax=Bacillus solimangrovi TaxID=1305675 RepID=A0A1E5LDW1_9BACI|nr:efflux RND transporter permease subunit [Bacillus solimangrovi]OEH92219.1 hypothetical protein BFG57_02820 [Bacillus solimangrovi]
MISFAVKRSVAFVMLLISLIAGGVYSIQTMNVELLPEFKQPVVYISTNFSNASAEEVDELITQPLEQLFIDDKDVKEITSYSDKGYSRIELTVKSDIDYEGKVQEIRELVAKNESSFPEDAGTPNVRDGNFDSSEAPVFTFSILGLDEYNDQKTLLADVEKQLEQIDGVGQVSVEGTNAKQVSIELDPLQLAKYRLASSDIVSALEQTSTQSIGQVSKSGESVQVVLPEKKLSLKDIQDVLIPIASGEYIKMSDVATVDILNEQAYRIYKINGKRAIGIYIMKDLEANTVTVTDEIQATIDQITQTLPDGIEVHIGQNSGEFIKLSINQVLRNLMIGGILAVAVLWLFFRSIRSMFIIMLSIPLSIITVFILLRFAGQTLNTISLSGLALGVGMMVDSSIVILENIVKNIQRKIPIYEAVRNGSSELRSAVVASTLTTVIVFVPLFMTDDVTIASILFPFAFAVIFTLLTALVAALTIVPMLSFKWLENDSKIHEQRDKRWLRYVTFFYKKVLRFGLRRRWIIVTGTILLVGVSIYSLKFVGFEAMPDEDSGEIYIYVSYEEEKELDESVAFSESYDKIIASYDDMIETKQSTVYGNGFNYVLSLKGQDERELTTEEISDEILNQFEPVAGVSFYVNGQSLGASKRDMQMRVTLTGEEYDTLSALAEQTVFALEQIPDITYIEAPSMNGEPQLQLVVNKQLAAKYGLTEAQISSQLREAFSNGAEITFRDGDSWYYVKVTYPEKKSNSIEYWQSFMVRSGSGDYIPLSAIASFENGRGPISITRKDWKQEITITAGVDDAEKFGQANAAFNEALAQMPFPPGYEYKFFDRFAEDNEMKRKLTIALLVAAFLVYAVMAIQFNSYSQPFIIMCSLPPTVIGVVFGLLITGKTLSVPAFIGIIVLAGIVVNNAIVLVDYINQQRNSILTRKTILLQAGEQRLRPILMTTLTTVLGMVPMAIGIGDGSMIQQPIGIVTIFGLTVSMIFTLVFVPVVYSIFDDVIQFFKRMFKRKKKYIEPVSQSHIEG